MNWEAWAGEASWQIRLRPRISLLHREKGKARGIYLVKEGEKGEEKKGVRNPGIIQEMHGERGGKNSNTITTDAAVKRGLQS